jgi:16S rRNA (adenine1518-N6/adenine1519-N6)-dimethyltransferase
MEKIKNKKVASKIRSNFGSHTGSMPRKKKSLGQHFLKNLAPVESMIKRVDVDKQTTVLEIGCGDGILTRQILERTKCKKLLCYEIDHEWANYVKEKIIDQRLEIKNENVLGVDFRDFEGDGSWVVLANLPYQVTFPIIFLLQRNKRLFREGVVMVQEEVAQKLVATSGRSYSATIIFLQQHFQFELMEKISPDSFSPPPKVFSRLIYFKSIDNQEMPEEKDFWRFLKICFSSPRRTLRNNLKLGSYKVENLDEEVLNMRAQQIPKNEFVKIWKMIS